MMGNREIVFLVVVLLFTTCTSDKGSVSVENNRETFNEVENIYQKWMRLITIPDAAYVTRYPSYSYNSNSSDVNIQNLLRFQNISDLLQFQNISDLLLNHLLLPSNGSESKCVDDLITISFNVKQRWALAMLDSDGKPASGIFRGVVVWPGNYDECLSVEAPVDEDNDGGFRGQYCSLVWNLTKLQAGMQLTTGICLPDSCTSEDAKNSFEVILYYLEMLPYIKKYASYVSLTSASCKPRERSLDGSAITFITFLVIFGVLMLLGSLITIYEYYEPLLRDRNLSTEKLLLQNAENVSINIDTTKPTSSDENAIAVGKTSFSVNDKDSLTGHVENGIPSNTDSRLLHINGVKKFLKCFCVLTNGSKILNTTVSGDQLLCIHGIRFFSLSWVILGHTYVFGAPVIASLLDFLQDADNWTFQVIIQGTLSVDSFFLLSGFLLTYLFLKEAVKREGKVNWIYFYIHRYWRLTPAYMVIVGFQVALFNYMGEGPFWPDQKTEIETCQKTWWWNLLYINNFVSVNDMCIGWSWYLANDMQFYVISPIFLYALYKRPKIGFGVILTLLLSSWITTIVVSHKFELIPMFDGLNTAAAVENYQEKMWQYFDELYDKPYCRIGPYLIGVILGYIVHKTGEKKGFLCWWQQLLGWLVAAYCTLSVIYGLYHAYLTDTAIDFYNAFNRSSYSIGLAWVIYACLTGHGGYVNKFLSYKLWIPLSRLTYCAYLIHPFVIRGYYQGLQNTLPFSHATMVFYYLGFLVSSYGVALVTSLAFESPMMGLEKMVLKRFS